MKQILQSLIVISSFTFTNAQDSTKVKRVDSLKQKVIQYTPYYSQSWLESGSYVKTVSDSNLLQFSNGVSIFNALRGQVPSLVMSPDYFNASFAQFRVDFDHGPYPFLGATVVIDGVPYNSLVGKFFSLKAIDYSSISAVSSASPVSFLNGQTYETGSINSGAFLLASKTGEGLKRPTFDFNSYTTTYWDEYHYNSGKTYYNHYWTLSNNLSYAQDFGKADIRVSYNYQANPFWDGPNSNSKQKVPQLHYLKINTGFKLSKKFTGRVIFDGSYRDLSRAYSGITGSGNFGNINLSLKYQILKRLNATMQTAYTRADSSYVYYNSLANESFRLHRVSDRLFTNMAVNYTGNFKSFNFKPFIAVQYINEKRRLPNYGGYYDFWIKSPTLLGGINAHLGQYLFADFVIKHVTTKLRYESKTYNGWNYSLGGAFVLTGLIDIPIFKVIKLRSNYNSNQSVLYATFPLENVNYYSSRPNTINNWETGIDIIFSKPDIRLTVNYFKNIVKYPKINNGGSNFPYPTYKGWEVDLQYNLIKLRTIQYSVGLLWSSFQTTKTNRTLLFNQIQWKNIALMATFESAKRDVVYSYYSEFLKLRDVSLGYRVPFRQNRKIVKGAFVSISGRNLKRFKSTVFDFEDDFNTHRKSASVNITLTF